MCWHHTKLVWVIFWNQNIQHHSAIIHQAWDFYSWCYDAVIISALSFFLFFISITFIWLIVIIQGWQKYHIMIISYVVQYFPLLNLFANILLIKAQTWFFFFNFSFYYYFFAQQTFIVSKKIIRKIYTSSQNINNTENALKNLQHDFIYDLLITYDLHCFYHIVMSSRLF